MGNSNKALADVTVVLEKNIFFRGETINGKITIYPNKDGKLNTLHNPEFRFRINQKRHWESRFNHEKDQTNIGGDNCLSSSKDQVLNLPNLVNVNFSSGITIPFQFVVPNDTLPSLEWPHTSSVFACIRNYLCIIIPELKYSHDIYIIIQKSPSTMTPPLEYEKREEIKTLGLFSNGYVSAKCSYPQYSYPIFGIIPLTVVTDSTHCEEKIREVVVKLKRKIELFEREKEKCYKDFLEEMYVETQEVHHRNNTLHFKIPFKDSTDIEYDLESIPVKFDLNALGGICCFIPNIKTDIIRINYYIKIKVVVEGLTTNSMEFHMPVDFHVKKNDFKNDIFNSFEKDLKIINSSQFKIQDNKPFIGIEDPNYVTPFGKNNQKPFNYHTAGKESHQHIDNLIDSSQTVNQENTKTMNAAPSISNFYNYNNKTHKNEPNNVINNNNNRIINNNHPYPEYSNNDIGNSQNNHPYPEFPNNDNNHQENKEQRNNIKNSNSIIISNSNIKKSKNKKLLISINDINDYGHEDDDDYEYVTSEEVNKKHLNKKIINKKK